MPGHSWQAINKGAVIVVRGSSLGRRSLDVERKGHQLLLDIKRKAFIVEVEIILFGNDWLWNDAIGQFNHMKIAGIIIVTVLDRLMFYMKSAGQVFDKAIYIFTLLATLVKNINLVYLCYKHREIDMRKQYYEGNYFHCEAKDIYITNTSYGDTFYKTC